MMKMKKILVTIIALLMLFSITFYTKTYATDDTTIQDDWTDVSNVTFSWDNADNTYNNPSLVVNNLEYKEDGDYYIYLSNTNEQIDVTTYQSYSDWTDNGWKNIRSDYSKVPNLAYVLEINKPIYVWIGERRFNEELSQTENKVLIEAKELERPRQFNIGSRLKAYFFNDYTSTFCFEPYTEDRNMVINYKIGEVTDVQILKDIKNGESDCLDNLMEYAKSAANGKTGSIKLGEDKSITNDLNLVNEKYYYVYMEVEDEDGKYYPIEDVSLYQALVGETVGNNLFDYLSDQFKWNIDESNVGGDIIIPDKNDDNNNNDSNKDNTIASGVLPQTGVGITIGIIIAIIIGFNVYLAHKNKKFRDIK